MITESQMYWITRLDALNMWLKGVGAIGVTVGIITLFIFIVAQIADDADSKKILKHVVWFKIVAPIATTLGLLLLLARSFIPTAKEYALIKVAPMITSEKSAEVAGELYDLAKEWAKDSLETDKPK